MLRSMRWPLLMMACFIGLLCSGLAAMAAPAAPAGIAVLDLDAVAKGYIGYQKAMQRLDNYTKEREGRFTALRAGVGLPLTDFDEYQRLAGGGVKVNPTRIKELEDLAAKNMTEYRTLQKKEPCTDEEKTRKEQLEKDLKSVSAKLNEVGTKMSKEIDAEQTRYTAILVETMNKAVGRVAESKKLSIVLNRAAQVGNGSERIVLWGGTDITEDVIKTLNQEFKDSLLDGSPK